jgi:hypothetical protein
MKMSNVHERTITAPAALVGALLDMPNAICCAVI